jgi:hypothetical protein
VVVSCRECGEQASREFCNSGCRGTFHNRRKQRGAALYDVVMSMRHDRETARAGGAWSLLCRMAADFKSDDDEKRAGRRSWDPICVVKARHSRLAARRLVQVRR